MMRYNNIIYNDTVDGCGQRIAIYTQGCCCHCP